MTVKIARGQRLILSAAWLVLAVGPGIAEVVSVSSPIMVDTTTGEASTMASPRWKGHIDPIDADRMWIMHGDGSSWATNIVFTIDGGASWNNTGMQAIENGFLNYHSSIFGYGGDLYVASPSDGVKVRHWEYPAASNDDRRNLVVIPGTTSAHRSVNMVSGSGRWWVFTRLTGTPSENAKYGYSDNLGDTWTFGTAFATGHEDIRFGAMPLADGTPVLVVLYLTDDRGYQYYKWDGTSFVARPDHAIWPQNVGWDKSFTHNVVGNTMHLIFRDGSQLQHCWKDHANGTGQWNYEVVPTAASSEIAPVCTVRGNELYLFYSYRTNDDDVSTSRIRAIVWNQASESWGEEIPVSTTSSSHNEFPNTCFSVPTSSSYVPVFWTAGSAGDRVMFSKLNLAETVSTPDTPAAGGQLLPNYPNPFNPQTVVPFELSRDGAVRLTVHDLAGRLVAVLVDGNLAAGRHEATWRGVALDGTPLPSGSYHARLQTGGESTARQLILVR